MPKKGLNQDLFYRIHPGAPDCVALRNPTICQNPWVAAAHTSLRILVRPPPKFLTDAKAALPTVSLPDPVAEVWDVALLDHPI